MPLAIFLLAAMISAGGGGRAQVDSVDEKSLRDALAAFVADEIEAADTPDLQAAMTDCIYPVFAGIEQQMIAQVLAESDFERGLGIVLTAYPEREEIIERCEDLLEG